MPLLGRKFTWYRPDGLCKSRLDRCLVTTGWLDQWSNACLWALNKVVSDHCAIVLKSEDVNWGPKPFRFLNSWRHEPSYADFVRKE
uniref:Endonuclease/exonuclease/phosphatase domain-containing protein n=1 Tax=Cajanus cajan TaxID=3821 RepID=A0A151S6N9_CAJCA|nr:hypothetical protein KK1_027706 [Cajanus cajan]